MDPHQLPHLASAPLDSEVDAQPDLQPDLVVLSHLRWTWVWQRPQHLVSRLARDRRAWFVEEPAVVPGLAAPRLGTEARGAVVRVWLEVPGEQEALLPFGGPESQAYAALLQELLADRPRDVWLYSPMALDVAEALEPRLLAYDVMDDLASFAKAPEGLRLRQRRALAEADVVFTGGRSLHRGVLALRGAAATHLFPSGVEVGHYARSRQLRRPHDRPVVGWVGVVDERLDLDLLEALAERLPEWDVQVVGPVAKIDGADLPQLPNVAYLGKVDYAQLPEVMAGFDVAMMPFALNDATRSISPTKTLEYLAAGLPVVSTRVPDVVADWGDVVHLVDDAAGFADACRLVLEHPVADRDRRVAPLRARHEWDAIATTMQALLAEAAAQPVAARAEETA